MKHQLLFLILSVMISIAASAQVGINTASPNSSAALDVTSTDKGLLIPRVASTGDVTAPTAGMMVYQTGATAGFYFYDGQWTLVKSDNLGNHTATTNLNMASQDIIAVDSIGAAKAKIGPNTYPTTTGTNGQVLTTNGAGTLSWGSASGGGGAQLLVRASANMAQTFNVGTSFVVGLPVTCMGNATTNVGSAWNGATGVFTAPSDGLYMVSAQTISTTNISLVPVFDVDNNQATPMDGITVTGGASDFFGLNVGPNSQTHPSAYIRRGQLQALIYLTANQTFSLRVHGSSHVTGIGTASTDGSTNITIVKLN